MPSAVPLPQVTWNTGSCPESQQHPVSQTLMARTGRQGSEPFPHRSPDSWGRGEVNRRQRHTDAWDCLSLADTDWAGQEKSRVKVIYGSSLSGLVERGEKVPVSQEGTSGVSPS